MKKRLKVTTYVISIIFGIVLVLPSLVYAGGPIDGNMPDKNKPVPATNVELVKKVSTMKPGPPIVPPGKNKPSKKDGVATGILGDSYSGSRYAVVVGISDYPGNSNDLVYSDDDATEMAAALSSCYNFTNVVLLTDMDATRSNIIDEIADIPNEAGEIVFFFSGHGMNGIAEDGDKERTDEAIVAHDGSSTLVPIWDGELKTAFSGFATSRIIFIFDTCLAGGMDKDLQEPGRIIAMAATERGYAYESSEWENGEFSYYFVDDGILSGLANIHDYDEDSILREPEQVTVEESFDHAKSNCRRDKPIIGDYFDNDLLP